MTMYVLIENKPTGRVTASLIGWPSMTVQGNTEVEAMNALRQLIASHLKDARIVPLDIETERTWLQTAGVFKDDPFAAEFDELMSGYRREHDDENSPELPQDHAA
ncbi:type II toxin-antitoxin system HicB family antitoxin [Roseiflexus sp.]|jgi:predicted RNase H-like HicB family nuclease